jgi:hypothetical protein
MIWDINSSCCLVMSMEQFDKLEETKYFGNSMHRMASDCLSVALKERGETM